MTKCFSPRTHLYTKLLTKELGASPGALNGTRKYQNHKLYSRMSYKHESSGAGKDKWTDHLLDWFLCPGKKPCNTKEGWQYHCSVVKFLTICWLSAVFLWILVWDCVSSSSHNSPEFPRSIEIHCLPLRGNVAEEQRLVEGSSEPMIVASSILSGELREIGRSWWVDTSLPRPLCIPVQDDWAPGEGKESRKHLAQGLINKGIIWEYEEVNAEGKWSAVSSLVEQFYIQVNPKDCNVPYVSIISVDIHS